MQDTPDITGAGIQYGFIWLYTLEIGSFILVQWTAAQVYSIIFLSNFLLDYANKACNQRGFNNVAYTTASLPRQMLTTRAGPSRCGAQCKIWARGPMQDLSAGPLWAVILWLHRVQSTVLRSW